MRRKVPFRALLGSESVKLRSLRATWWCAVAYLLLAGGAGWLAAGTELVRDPAALVSAALPGFGVGQLALVVLGALAVTSDFGSGMSLASLTAVPRRTRLLVAKTVVVGTWCASLALVPVAVCAFAGLTSTGPSAGAALVEQDVLRLLGLHVGAAALTGVLAVGLGAVLRSTAVAVAAGMVLVALPPALAVAGGAWLERLAQALPAIPGTSLPGGGAAHLTTASAWQTGLAVIAAWAVAAWVLGAVLLERRDA